MLIGSTYSEANRGGFGLRWFNIARSALIVAREADPDFMRNEDNIFALLLLCSLAVWSGERDMYERAESDRSSLIFACKRQRLLDCRSRVRPDRSDIPQLWRDWINLEQRRRLGLSIYVFDCQMAALLNNPPFVAKSELVHTALPCAESYWAASTAQRWKVLLGPSDMPPSTYYLTTLTTILLHDTTTEIFPFPDLDEFSRTLFVYGLHTHIYDWRQLLCLINGDGLMRSVRALGPQSMGPALLERKEWLQKSLFNWNTHYGDRDTARLPNAKDTSNPRGTLVYYLGVLATKVSFADLHLVNGHSRMEEDVSLAEEALHNWLQTDDAKTALNLTQEMMSLAHHIIASGEVFKCSLELVVCLFMGGLIIWARCRLRGSGEDDGLGKVEDEARRRTDAGFSLSEVTRASQALRSLWQCRVGLLFGTILDRLCKNAS
ncbi:Transcription factor PfmaH [Paramyrothecium foliicola]|nr:Transcription factor PfmaH [Paramyrothecium foliicola]